MTRSLKHVGLDVHQATCIAAVRTDAGRAIARSVLPTDATAMTTCFREMRGPGRSTRTSLERGMRPELARVTLTRKLAAVTLHVWKTGERYDATKLMGLAR